MKTRQTWCHAFWCQAILALWSFMWHKGNMRIFLYCLIQHTATAHAYLSHHGFILAIRQLSVTWISFRFVWKNKMTWNEKKLIKEKRPSRKIRKLKIKMQKKKTSKKKKKKKRTNKRIKERKNEIEKKKHMSALGHILW